jgi:hypothetical protein
MRTVPLLRSRIFLDAPGPHRHLPAALAAGGCLGRGCSSLGYLRPVLAAPALPAAAGQSIHPWPDPMKSDHVVGTTLVSAPLLA